MLKKLTLILAASLVLSACGSRSIGSKIDDQIIHPNVNSAVRKAHPDLKRPTSHIVTTSYNGVVLLAGEVPNAGLKATAEQAARSVKGVTVVHNEIDITYPTPISVRSNDSLLTSKVKSRLLVETDVASTKVKVVTVRGVVYLLGVVTRVQADNITHSVQQVGGVQKIVRLFEYIN